MRRLKMAGFVLFLAAALATAYLTNLHQIVSRGALRHYIACCGHWAYAAYVIIYGLLVTLGFPASVLTVSGALVFGTWLNTALSIAGATLGACVSFVIARSLARDWVAERFAGRAQELDRRLSRDGVLAIMLLRLLPVVPFNVVNYASGLTGLSFRTYTWASVVGMAPGMFAYSYITNQAVKVDLKRPETLLDPGLLLSFALIVVLTAVVPVIWRRRRRDG